MQLGDQGLGDLTERALASLGVTQALVEKWVGRPCGCKRRKRKMNALGWWARMVLGGKAASQHLARIMENDDEH